MREVGGGGCARVGVRAMGVQGRRVRRGSGMHLNAIDFLRAHACILTFLHYMSICYHKVQSFYDQLTAERCVSGLKMLLPIGTCSELFTHPPPLFPTSRLYNIRPYHSKDKVREDSPARCIVHMINRIFHITDHKKQKSKTDSQEMFMTPVDREYTH